MDKYVVIVSALSGSVDKYLKIVEGTDMIPIQIRIKDFNMPEGASALVYAKAQGMAARVQTATINGNAVEFTPNKGFFVQGENMMQGRITKDGKDLITFAVFVICKKSIITDDAEETNSDPTLLQQLLSEIGVISARTSVLASLKEGSTTGDAELIDGRTDYKGNTHTNIGDHIRLVSGQLSEEIDDHSEYTGRKLLLEYGYFSTTDFTGGNEQKSRLKSEIISGKNENVSIDIPEGLLCDILKLKNGESTATYLVSGIVGENTYLFESGYDYRMLFKNVDGSTFSYIPIVWLAYGEKNVDVRFNTTENKCKRIKNKNVKKAISEHYIFEDTSGLSQFTNLVGTNDELTVTENGLSLAGTQSTNNILMLSNNDDIKRMVVGTNGAVAVLVACEVSAKKGQSLYISEKGFVYIAEHLTDYKGNTLTNIGEFHATNLYYVTLYGNKVIVKNECGQSLEYEGLKYPSNIGISFPYDRDCRIKSFAVISDQAKYTLNMLYEMSKNTFESNNFVSYSYASSNPNAIKVNYDVACPFYEFNCDKAYGESDIGSDRYRTEIGFNLHKELVPNGRISFEFYLPSESNKIDTHDDVIIQLHDGGGKYTDYRLAPPIALAVNNGKLVLWLNYNEKEPSVLTH